MIFDLRLLIFEVKRGRRKPGSKINNHHSSINPSSPTGLTRFAGLKMSKDIKKEEYPTANKECPIPKGLGLILHF